MGHRDEVLDFLHKIAPKGASNAEIVSHTRIKPHQQVFQITRALANEGLIKRRRAGREWTFFAGNTSTERSEAIRHSSNSEDQAPESPIGPEAFEVLCQRAMSEKFGKELRPGHLDDVPKELDLVSEDGSIAGDAKYYTAVNGISLPPAKFATIAEYVWLLEKTKAKRRFLVFGNDRRVPQWWLDRYGDLLGGVSFYFLSDKGELNILNDQYGPNQTASPTP